MVAKIALANTYSRLVVERAGFQLVEVREGPAVEDLVPAKTCIYEMKL